MAFEYRKAKGAADDLIFVEAVFEGRKDEPAAIRRVLLDNAANYQKDNLQRRVLSAGLGEGLLSAEGDRWRAQRHC